MNRVKRFVAEEWKTMDKAILKQLVQAAMEGSEPPLLNKEELSPYLRHLAARGIIVRTGYFNRDGIQTLEIAVIAHRSPPINVEIDRILSG